jgi:hypothetical protein
MKKLSFLAIILFAFVGCSQEKDLAELARQRSLVADAYSKVGAIMGEVDLCLQFGKLRLGTAPGECSFDYTCSSSLTGSELAPGVSVCPAGSGVPQLDSVKLHSNRTVTATFGNSAPAALQGKVLVLARQSDGSWRCADSIPDELRVTDKNGAFACERLHP